MKKQLSTALHDIYMLISDGTAYIFGNAAK